MAKTVESAHMTGTMAESRSAGRAEIDTSSPFESVREAATRFGGFGFWRPSYHNTPAASKDDDILKLEAKAAELENDLVVKEGETMEVLKALESTKAHIEELKSELQKKYVSEEKDCEITDHGQVLKELNQAKMNLCKTTQDLAGFRVSVEMLNKKLEEERSALDKTRERLIHKSIKQDEDARLSFSKISDSETTSEISKEIQRLNHEAKEFKKTGRNARSAVGQAMAGIKHTRNKIKTAEIQLIMKKAEEYASNTGTLVETVISNVSNNEILEIIEEAAQEIKSSRKTLEEGLENVNKANTTKLEAEYMLRKWRSEQRKRSSCSVNNTAKFKNSSYLQQNRIETRLNMLNDKGASSVPTMSIGQILSRKLLTAEELIMNGPGERGKVSLGQILGKVHNGNATAEKENQKRVTGKRKKFGFPILSVMLNKDTNKKKKIALNLKG